MGSVSALAGVLAACAAMSPAPLSNVSVIGAANWAWAGLADGADDPEETMRYHYKT